MKVLISFVIFIHGCFTFLIDIVNEVSSLYFLIVSGLYRKLLQVPSFFSFQKYTGLLKDF